jgi:hypothetical protein
MSYLSLDSERVRPFVQSKEKVISTCFLNEYTDLTVFLRLLTNERKFRWKESLTGNTKTSFLLMDFLADLATFLFKSVVNLITLLSGVVAIMIDILRRRYGWEVPNNWYVWIVVVCLMFGMFSTWRDEHRALEQVHWSKSVSSQRMRETRRPEWTTWCK